MGDITAVEDAEGEAGRVMIEMFLDLIRRAMALDLEAVKASEENGKKLTAIFNEASAMLQPGANQTGASGFLQALNAAGNLVTFHYFIGIALEMETPDLPHSTAPVQ